MGEGDAAAAAIYSQAYGKNPQFYTYYKSLEAYRASFSKPGDVLVVDPSSSFFQFMKDPTGQALAPVTVPDVYKRQRRCRRPACGGSGSGHP